MTWDQYWYGDCWMVEAFRKADELRQERQNNEAWLQGIYIAKAIESTIGNAFLEKGSKPNSYPEKPFDLRGKATDETTEEQEEREATIALAWMSNFVQAGKNWGK